MWKVVGASVRGPDHEQTGLPCQDAHGHRLVEERLIAAVADGAGSARFSEAGAQLLCEAVVSTLADRTGPLDDLDDWRAAVEVAVGTARAEVEALVQDNPADDPPATAADYHATLVGVVAGPEGGIFFHIGDGTAAAVPDGADWGTCTLSLPANGEFANETYFFTQDDWRQHLRLTAFGPSPLIVMVSDGAMPFTVAEGFSGLEERFLGPVTGFLDTATPEAGCRALAATLDGADARRISGDDKTLLWARRLAEP